MFLQLNEIACKTYSLQVTQTQFVQIVCLELFKDKIIICMKLEKSLCTSFWTYRYNNFFDLTQIFLHPSTPYFFLNNS